MASTKTCIDHILTNTESKVVQSGVIPCGISDHDIVYMIKNMRIHKARNLPKVQTVRNYKKFDLNEFHADIMYQSIPSLTDPRGFAHPSCPRGRVFAPLSCPGVCPGDLKSK